MIVYHKGSLMVQKYTKNKSGQKPFLDTLAQLPTKVRKKDLKNLQKRARSKWFTQGITLSLVDLKSPLTKYYWSAYHCNTHIEQQGLQLKSRYCNTRTCHICNRIRTAKMMNGYLSQLSGRTLEFVTLTIPNVSAEQLSATVDDLIKTSTKIMRVFRERRHISINGIRKIEITYNPDKNTYHPHIHLIVDKAGQLIVDEWLKRYPKASRKAQDCRPADQSSLNELFKYSTKIVGHKEGNLVVYASALDNIMLALRNKRCFQPFGDVRKVSEEVSEELEGEEYDIQEQTFMVWTWKECDWVNTARDTLTGYISPDVDFVYLYT